MRKMTSVLAVCSPRGRLIYKSLLKKHYKQCLKTFKHLYYIVFDIYIYIYYLETKQCVLIS